MSRKDKPSVRVIKEQIIEFYRNNPMLYDKTNPHYKATDLHEEILQDFAVRLSLEVKEVTQYWSNLKSNYQSKLREIKSSLISGTGVGDERFPNKKNKPEDWEYFQLLSFLNDSIESQGRLSACNMPKIELKDLVLSPPKKVVLGGKTISHAAPRGIVLQQGHADGKRVCFITKEQLERLSTVKTKMLMSTVATSSSSVTHSVMGDTHEVDTETKVISWAPSLLSNPSAKASTAQLTVKKEPGIQMKIIDAVKGNSSITPPQIKKEIKIAVKPEIVENSGDTSEASAMPSISNYKKRKMEKGNFDNIMGSVGDLIKSQVAPMQQSAIELIDIVKKQNSNSHPVEPESSACAVQMKGLAMQMEKLPQHVQDELLLSFMQQIMKAKRENAGF